MGSRRFQRAMSKRLGGEEWVSSDTEKQQDEASTEQALLSQYRQPNREIGVRRAPERHGSFPIRAGTAIGPISIAELRSEGRHRRAARDVVCKQAHSLSIDAHSLSHYRRLSRASRNTCLRTHYAPTEKTTIGSESTELRLRPRLFAAERGALTEVDHLGAVAGDAGDARQKRAIGFRHTRVRQGVDGCSASRRSLAKATWATDCLFRRGERRPASKVDVGGRPVVPSK
jgi:hypothetical protein